MDSKHRDTDAIQRYWNSRAKLGVSAGTKDLMLKHLETEAIAAWFSDGMQVLEIGCGNGLTALNLAQRYDVSILGVDYAQEMVDAALAHAASATGLRGSVSFQSGDLTSLPNIEGGFDLAYTERVLINLDDWPAQRDAIANIGRRLKPEGRYLMCEHSQDGLDRINEFRQAAGLEPIRPPWHNLYFRDANLNGLRLPGLVLEQVIPFSSTYYFISRVVNAWLAQREQTEPNYDAPVNQLALLLPPVGHTAQGKLWVWRRTTG